MFLPSECVTFFIIFVLGDVLQKGSAATMPPYTLHDNRDGIAKIALNEQNDVKIDNDCINTTKNLDELSQNQFLKLLTSDCRYDRLTKPDTLRNSPLNITVRMDIRHIELLDQQQFKMDTLIQYRYIDERLNFERLSPRREHVLGREMVKSRIWIPHVVVAHEKDAKVMGLVGKDLFVSISPQGEVSYSYRTSILVYCWMDFRKFPFDKQICRMTFQNWMYNASKMMLRWEDDDPVKFSSQMHLTGFVLEGFWTLHSLIVPPIATGAFGGNYSALEFKFKVAREIGYYLMDYFIPSIMLVCTSWVTFWLQADNGAPRTTLGTSTMLSFITLACGQTKTLPKVSYIKISEIWFLGCSIFIFASMVEFAFVNIIWRRRKAVELKKVNSKYIFKCTLTPSLARNELYQSSTSIGDTNSNLNVNGLTLKSINTDDSINNTRQNSIVESELTSDDCENKTWTTMTPHEVANWIDKRSRVAFPVAFLIFNIFFWTSALSVAHES